MTENLHEDLNDTIVREFFETNEDLGLDVEITWQVDLGFRLILSSCGDTFTRAGHPTSLSLGLIRLVERAKPKVDEYREEKAKIQAAYDAAMAEDDDD